MDLKNTLHSPVLKDIAFLLLISWLARAAFLFVLPEGAISADLSAWNTVAHELSLGHNPYQTTGLLNWPPFWIQIIFILSSIAAIIDIPLTLTIQCFLIAIESLSLAVTYFCARRFFPQAPVRKILFFGVSLNPISIYQVCQQGNFDVMVGLWVILFVYFILTYLNTNNNLDWLIACMFIGIGIVTKSTPVMLLPLCLLRINSLPWKARCLGAFLIAFPVCLGMGLLYVLTPEDIALKVIGYRSSSGWFGITGILALLPYWGPDLISIYVKCAPLGFLVFMVYMGIHVVRHVAVTQQDLLWQSLLVFLMVITFGPGYGPQYIGWILPLFLLVYIVENKSTQNILKIMLGIAIITYTIEYALFPSHGAFLLKDNPSQFFHDISTSLSTRTGQTVIRLPLFFCYLLLFRLGWRRINV